MPLPCVETETGPSPRHSIVWLHGLGADGNDFAPIVPQLADRAGPALRFVFPHAPVRPVTVNGGMRMRAWYDIQAFDLHARQDEAGMRASIAEVEALIERETARGVAAEHILLAGFSQGGAIALATALRHRQTLAGAIALSTYLPLQAHSAAERSAANAKLPVFMGHGSLDPIVPMALGLRSRDALTALGHGVDWHGYVMAHQICPEEIADLRAWIGVRLRGAPG